jgi:hypothetical protein
VLSERRKDGDLQENKAIGSDQLPPVNSNVMHGCKKCKLTAPVHIQPVSEK